MKGTLITLMVTLVTATAGAQGRAPRDARTVVFVCEHGTVKSVIAMAWFDRLARGRGLPHRAISRGTAPDSALPTFVLDGLRGDGFELLGFIPRPLSQEDLDAASVIVSLDAPDVVRLSSQPVLQWSGMPSVSAHYGNGRDAIKRQVQRLIDSLVIAEGR